MQILHKSTSMEISPKESPLCWVFRFGRTSRTSRIGTYVGYGHVQVQRHADLRIVETTEKRYNNDFSFIHSYLFDPPSTQGEFNKIVHITNILHKGYQEGLKTMFSAYAWTVDYRFMDTFATISNIEDF